MRNVIKWEDYLGLPPATEEVVAAVEVELDIHFPLDFRKAPLLHQGQLPRPGMIERIGYIR